MNEESKIIMEEPVKCIGCGWDSDNENQSPAIEDRWLIIPIPQSVVWLYICPKCGAAMGNKNAVENIKKLQEIKNQRIIKPPQAGVVPARLRPGLVTRN